jgi:uncharacterized protein (DUF1501 family)
MKRRDFIRNTLAGVVLPSFLNGISLKALAGTPMLHALSGYMHDDRVLVLIQLSGGNDGLNMVIPIDQYSQYQAARPNIALPQDKILRLQGFDQTGLHPAMSGLHGLFNEGKLGIVQGVGYPKPSYSHFRATDIWMTASDSDKVLNTGWTGRLLNDIYPDFPDNYPNVQMPDPLGIQVGSVVATAFQGPVFTMGLAIANPSNFYNLIEGKVNIDSPTRWGEQLDYLEQMSLKTDQYAGVIKKAALKVTKQSDKYPAKNGLADQLKIVARLIAGGLKTKVYMVSTSGFDTHAKQAEEGDKTTGTQANLLKRVSEAVTAFMDDLQQQGLQNRVMGITFSEFGRRIKSNASGGTDHGAAAPLFYFGHNIKPGMVGSNPIIPDAVKVTDNVPMQHDFRSVYNSILQNWLGLQPADAEKILQTTFPTLPIV